MQWQNKSCDKTIFPVHSAESDAISPQNQHEP
jgi:hypothetical protein